MKYKMILGVPSDDLIAKIASLEEKVFDHRSMDKERLRYEYSTKEKVTTFLAFDDDLVVGYKIGYEQRKNKYYSWVGGVHPDFRSKGIGNKLMSNQHEWAKNQGYKCILTKTGNEYRNMLLLNIKFGFDIRGTFLNSRNIVRIEMKKDL